MVQTDTEILSLFVFILPRFLKVNFVSYVVSVSLFLYIFFFLSFFDLHLVVSMASIASNIHWAGRARLSVHRLSFLCLCFGSQAIV